MAQIENKFSSSPVFYYVIIILYALNGDEYALASRTQRQQNEHGMMIYNNVRIYRRYSGRAAKIFEIYYSLENEWMNVSARM